MWCVSVAVLLCAIAFGCLASASDCNNVVMGDSGSNVGGYSGYNGNGSAEGGNGSDYQPQAMPMCGEVDAYTPQPRDWCCDCYNFVDHGDIVSCRCMGASLFRVPQKMPRSVIGLAIIRANLQKLRVVGLQRYAATIEDIELADLPNFETIEPGALGSCEHLQSLYISNAPRLLHLPDDVFVGVSDKFVTLRIINSGLQHIPNLSFLQSHVIMRLVELENNQITHIKEHAVYVSTETFSVAYNFIEKIDGAAFEGSKIARLNLRRNWRLREIDPAAFRGLMHLQDLDLSYTSIQSLPTEGLDSLEALRIQNTHTLRTIPSVYNFKNLRVAWLTHPFHCCAFKFPSRHDPERFRLMQQYYAQQMRDCATPNPTAAVAAAEQSSTTTTTMTSAAVTPPPDRYHDADDDAADAAAAAPDWRPTADTYWTRVRRFAAVAGDDAPDGDGGDSSDDNPWSGFDAAANNIKPLTTDRDAKKYRPRWNFDFEQMDPNGWGQFHDPVAEVGHVITAICGKLTKDERKLDCYPEPDALNPCEDVMGAQWLRISVFVVVFLAVVGNVAVLVVLFSNCKDVTVTKFLMSNLAFADLCLGLYLLLIAAIDVHSIGEYFNYGYEWQYGFGCQAAGFLTVFASHLSVFTLCVITAERWFAITHAMQLNKRIRMRSALFIMLAGWSYSVLMSSLPLFGVSNYSSTSICIPMEARDTADIVYLVLMIGNSALAFIFIAVCYVQIYRSLGEDTRQAHGNAWRIEMTVTKKMMLLVFTNFACWAPIAFFGLTALAGWPLITVAQSKVLLVFFYPLNSCADPYLYAILTAQYRKDLWALLAKCGLGKGGAEPRQYDNNNTLPMLNYQTTTTVTTMSGRRSSSMDRSAGSRKVSRDFV